MPTRLTDGQTDATSERYITISARRDQHNNVSEAFQDRKVFEAELKVISPECYWLVDATALCQCCDRLQLSLWLFVRFRLQENVATSPVSPPANRAEMSLPLTNIAGAAVKPADNELLMASVLPAERVPTPQSEQPTPTDSAPSLYLPRAKIPEEISPEPKQAAPPATTPRSSENLESKLAPAPVSEADLIQPAKKGYMNRNLPDFKLANILKGSFEATESKDVRKSVELEGKDASESSKVAHMVPKSKLMMIFYKHIGSSVPVVYEPIGHLLLQTLSSEFKAAENISRV